MQETGLFLCLQPNAKDNATSYGVFIWNTCLSPCIAEILIKNAKNEQEEMQVIVQPNEKSKIDFLSFDDLNDRPQYFIQCQLSTTAGLSKKCEVKKKLNAKNVLQKKTINHHAFNSEIIIYELINSKQFNHTESKLELTSEEVVEHSHIKFEKFVDPKERVNFDSTIDLHIENLLTDSSSLSEDQIFQYQLSAFEKWLDEVIRLNIQTSYVIHGLGSGKLKNAIHKMLSVVAEVNSFNNNYHPNYGNGATEINL